MSDLTHYLCRNCKSEYYVGLSQPCRCGVCGSKEREELTATDSDLLEMIIKAGAVNVARLSNDMTEVTRESLQEEYAARIRSAWHSA